MSRLLSALFVLLACAGARAENSLPAPTALPIAADWTGRSAVAQPRAHGQVALLGESRLGLGRDLQLGLHLAGWGALAPNASLLYRFARGTSWHVAGRLGLAYPTPLLGLLTGKGAGALLPADTEPPQAFLVDPGVRLSLELPRGQLFTLEAAVTVAAKFTRGSSPLLDFPYLYPRFAALDSPFTVRLAATSEGVVVSRLRWVGSIDAWILPVVRHGFALEPRGGLAWAARRRVTLELGDRPSYAHYPVGRRFHNAPYLDLRVRF